jgi:sialidase-1
MRRRSFIGSLAAAAGLTSIVRSEERSRLIRYADIYKATPDHPRNDTANMLELRDGSLMVGCHRYYANERGITDFGLARIYAKVSRDGGASWDGDRMVIDSEPGDLNVQAPGLCRTRRGDILLNCNRAHAANSTTMLVFRSTDEGQTFHELSRVWQRTTGQWLQGGASGIVVLESGRLVMPFHYGTGTQGGQHNRASCFLSDDDGATWRQATGVIDLPMRGAMEASVAEHPDGFLAMSLRTQLGSVFLSTSRDAGETWTPAQVTGLKAPESCSCLRRIPGTRQLVLFWNDSEYLPSYDHYGKRTPLTAAISGDGGAIWQRVGDIESGDGEFTNLNCTFLANGNAAVTYFRSAGQLRRKMIDCCSALIDRQWFSI